MPEKFDNKGLTANQLYDLKVTIKDLDYTNDTVEVVMTSSLSTAYQVIDITFILDPNDIILEDIFGGEPIKLQITLLREQEFPGPSINVELMYLTSSFQLVSKDKLSSTTQKDRIPFTIKTLVREPFKTMATMVNNVFIGTNLNSVISSLATTVGTTVEYDTNGQNVQPIDQVCIPPVSFYKIIKEYSRLSDDIFDGFLDQRFGLFSGTPSVFCQFDNKVYIKNLTAKLQRDQAFTVYQLSAGGSDKLTQKIFEDSNNTGTVFYTYTPIETSYAGTSRFADVGTTINQIVRPKDALTLTMPMSLDALAESYSLMYSEKNKNLYIDENAKRTRYYNEDTGNESSFAQFHSRYGRLVSDLSSVSIDLERNLPVLNLIDVGECVKFKPTTVEYADFEGKYILWSSILKFSRGGPSWESTCRINLNRTNKKK